MCKCGKSTMTSFFSPSVPGPWALFLFPIRPGFQYKVPYGGISRGGLQYLCLGASCMRREVRVGQEDR